MRHRIFLVALTGVSLSVMAGEVELKREKGTQQDPRLKIVQELVPHNVALIMISYLPQTWPFIQRKLQDPDAAVRQVQLFRDPQGNNRLMTLNRCGQLFLWNIAIGKRESLAEQILSTMISPTGNVVAYVRQEGFFPLFRLNFLDLTTRYYLPSLSETYDEPPAYTFSATEGHCASTGGFKLKIWDIKSEISLYNPVTFNIDAQVASLAPQGNRMLLKKKAHDGETIVTAYRITKDRRGRMDISRLWSIKQALQEPQFSPQGTYVVATTTAPTKQKESDSKLAHAIILLNPSSGTIMRTITHTDIPSPLHSCLMSSDEQRMLLLPMATTLADCKNLTLAIVDTTNGTPIKHYAAAFPQSDDWRVMKLVDIHGPYLAYVDSKDNCTVIIREQYGLSGTPADEEDEADQPPTPQLVPSSKAWVDTLATTWQRLSDAVARRKHHTT